MKNTIKFGVKKNLSKVFSIINLFKIFLMKIFIGSTIFQIQLLLFIFQSLLCTSKNIL